MERPQETYAESRAKQAEFEELEREEGDWQEAVDDLLEGKKRRSRPTPPVRGGHELTSGLAGATCGVHAS